jgi:hypothetical protein
MVKKFGRTRARTSRRIFMVVEKKAGAETGSPYMALDECVTEVSGGHLRSEQPLGYFRKTIPTFGIFGNHNLLSFFFFIIVIIHTHWYFFTSI